MLTQSREGQVSDRHFMPVQLLPDRTSAGDVIPQDDAASHIPRGYDSLARVEGKAGQGPLPNHVPERIVHV